MFHTSQCHNFPDTKRWFSFEASLKLGDLPAEVSFSFSNKHTDKHTQVKSVSWGQETQRQQEETG